MVELGADTITIEIPNLQNLISGSGVINHEFKWDLIDYLAAVPDAPVSSLEEMLELGLIHEALTLGCEGGTLRKAEIRMLMRQPWLREPLRNAVVSVIEENQVDALIYPTMREPPSIIGQPQRGSNCSLSANTGLPALSIPAGWTGGGLPIGLELLGSSLDDARLVALGYAYEQATNHRRAPVSAPIY